MTIADTLLTGCKKCIYDYQEWVTTNRKRNFKFCSECSSKIAHDIVRCKEILEKLNIIAATQAVLRIAEFYQSEIQKLEGVK